MAFRFDDRMINDYWQNGYMVFRGIVPSALIRDLRREADKARDYTHREKGPQFQRLQPLVKFPEVIDIQPFKDYSELPVLHDAITRMLGPDYRHSHLPIMGLLIEPAGYSWHHGWHRDGQVEISPEARDERLLWAAEQRRRDPRHHNQVNCAIYNDSCTWYVPGSHLRTRDLPGEVESSNQPNLPRKADDQSEAEFERICLNHCRDFPGAVQMHLAAGDYMVYRNNAWHCGNYLKYQPRATIHDSVTFHGDWSGNTVDWQQEKVDAMGRLKARRAAAEAAATESAQLLAAVAAATPTAMLAEASVNEAATD